MTMDQPACVEYSVICSIDYTDPCAFTYAWSDGPSDIDRAAHDHVQERDGPDVFREMGKKGGEARRGTSNSGSVCCRCEITRDCCRGVPAGKRCSGIRPTGASMLRLCDWITAACTHSVSSAYPNTLMHRLLCLLDAG